MWKRSLIGYFQKSNRFGCLFLLCCSISLFSCYDNTQERLSKAEDHLAAGNIPSAKMVYTQLLKKDSMNTQALQGMVQATDISNATQEHLTWCRKILKPIPWDRHANIVVGKQLADTGNLKDAAMRYILAYQSSVFKEEKREVLNLLSQLKRLELGEINKTRKKQNAQ